MSWLFSQALVEEYSAETCLDGAPSAQLSVMPTPHKFWHNGKMMDASDLSRFGLTSRLLTEDRGKVVLTSYLEDFPVRTSVPPARALDSTESAADCGVRWQGSLARYSPASSSWKTAQCSLLGDSEEFSETWPRWGSMRSGALYLRPTPALPTSERESGLLPTLTVVSCEHPGRVKVKPGQQTCISAELAARDGWERGGQYSPNHAAWFMGWPDSWTSLGHMATGKFQEWLKLHGKS